MADEDDPILQALERIKPAGKPAAAAAPPSAAPVASDDDPVLQALDRIGTRPALPPMPARFGPQTMDVLRARQAAQPPAPSAPQQPQQGSFWNRLNPMNAARAMISQDPRRELAADWGSIKQLPKDIMQAVTLPFEAGAAGARHQPGQPEDPELLKRMLMWGGNVAGGPELRAAGRVARAEQAAGAERLAKLGPRDKTAAQLGVPREGAASPVDMGTQVSREVAAAKPVEEAKVAERFKQAFDQPGEVHAGAFEGYGTRMKGQLGEQGHVVDKFRPQSSKALDYLDQTISKFKIENKAGPQLPEHLRPNIIGIKLKGLNQVRTNLEKLRAAAETAARNPNATTAHMDDAATMRQIVENFDNHVEKTIEDGLFSGDKKALTMLKEARASEKKLFETFNHGKIAKGIVENNMRPDEVGRLLFNLQDIGMGKEANEFWETAKGLLGQETQDKYRLALWNHFRDDPVKTVKFLDSTMGRSMFNPGERKLIMEAAHQPANTWKQDLAQMAINHLLPIAAHVAIPGHSTLARALHWAVRPALREAKERLTERYGGTGP